MDISDLPAEFDLLRKRKKQLQDELAEIERLEAHLKETRVLFARALNLVGRLTRDEFEKSPTYGYVQRFLQGTLVFSADELARLTS